MFRKDPSALNLLKGCLVLFQGEILQWISMALGYTNCAADPASPILFYPTVLPEIIMTYGQTFHFRSACKLYNVWMYEKVLVKQYKTLIMVTSSNFSHKIVFDISKFS